MFYKYRKKSKRSGCKMISTAPLERGKEQGCVYCYENIAPKEQVVKKQANTGLVLNFAGDPFLNLFKGFE
jgi:hypothetical protein